MFPLPLISFSQKANETTLPRHYHSKTSEEILPWYHLQPHKLLERPRHRNKPSRFLNAHFICIDIKKIMVTQDSFIADQSLEVIRWSWHLLKIEVSYLSRTWRTTIFSNESHQLRKPNIWQYQKTSPFPLDSQDQKFGISTRILA